MKKHVTVVPSDRLIIVEGEALQFDFAAPENLHAVQWHNGEGHMEFLDDMNHPLTEGDYAEDVAPFVTAWETEKARLEDEAAAAEAARLQAAEVSRSRASAATSSTSSSSVSNDGAVNAPVSANGAGVVAYASQFQGVPYVYGGTTPSGFDCSGFTQYVYSKFGISLPRIDYQQRVWAQAHGTKVSDPQPGDLMWRSGHVGIYVGNGLMIHAPRPGKSVSIVPVYASFEYYRII